MEDSHLHVRCRHHPSFTGTGHRLEARFLFGEQSNSYFTHSLNMHMISSCQLITHNGKAIKSSQTRQPSFKSLVVASARGVAS
jgi:hypothetical protein